MKKQCRYCNKAFDIRGLGPHESKCTSRPTQTVTVVTDAVDKFWMLLSREEKLKIIQRYLDEN